VELHRYLVLLRSRLPVLILTIVVGLVLVWVATPRQAKYRATSTIYVGSRVVDLKNPTDVQYGQIATLDRFIETFARMIDSEATAAPAVGSLRVGRSVASVVAATTARQIENTQLLAVDVVDADPAVAQRLANALAEAFIGQVQDLEGGGPAGEGTVPSLPAYVFERARLPTAPEPTTLASNLVIGAFVGLVGGIGLVVLLDYLDVTLRGIEDAEHRLELPVLGTIPAGASPVGPARAGRLVSASP
jgi:capsular polysaccharide biosynthesis protein